MEGKNNREIIQQIVGFHKVFKESISGIEKIETFQFTDAAFAVSPDFDKIIKFAIRLQNNCLAYNQLQIESKRDKLGYMLIPKVTIAYGDVLTIKKNLGASTDLAGLSENSLIAGNGIVHAYLIEGKIAGTQIGLYKSPEIAKLNVATNPNKKLKSIWSTFTKGEIFHQEKGKILEFPWIIFSNNKNNKNLRFDNLATIKEKIKAYMDVMDLFYADYNDKRLKLDIIKHWGGSIRHIKELLQYLRGRNVPSTLKFNYDELRNELNKLK